MITKSEKQKNRLASIFLPCLRCGIRSVAVFVPRPVKPFECPDLYCDNDGCGARHYLAVYPDRVVYDRDTRRYPSENYDDNQFPVIRLNEVRNSKQPDCDLSLDGPIVIQRRKKRFSSEELRAIFNRSNGKCHICKKRWALSERSMTGWHVDHVIANVGGGYDTEEIENFRIACARCNLEKGRGFTSKTIRKALKQLLK